ncbi:MAG: hypothetical protein K2P93_07725, partial [Alphaproteobacteria bacterium]|nr:hypothetical protein [Alphaproteobacteria bacterium]
MSELNQSPSVFFFGKGVLTISQSTAGVFTYSGLISSGSLARGREIMIEAAGSTIQLTGLTGVGSVPISGPVTITGGTLEGNTSPRAVLNLAGSGTGYNLNGTNQAISGLEGGQGSIVSLEGNDNTLTVGQDGVLTERTTFSGNITGAGSLELIGFAVLTLDGQNTYTGGTMLNDESQLIGTTTSITGNIVNDSTGGLTFDQNTNGTYAGDISGSGPLAIRGGGAITFTGANSYTGGTTINNDGSSLIGTTVSLVGDFNNKSTNGLTFNQSANGTYAGRISGSGPLIINPINGEGLITLSGTNTYDGGTKVYGGGLSIASSHNIGTGSLTLQNGATLQTTE